MTDLIERLRKHGAEHEQLYSHTGVCGEAATELERLTKENQDVNYSRQRWKDNSIDWEANCDRLSARIAVLEVALEPFADIDGEGDEDFADDTTVNISFGRTTYYGALLGDFRRAREALNTKDG